MKVGFWTGFLAGAIIGVVAAYGYWAVRRYENEMYVTRKYRGGVLWKVTVDRNHDGEPDSWEVYSDFEVRSWRADENFDGKVDRWYRRLSEYEAREQYDCDSNGVADFTVLRRYGVPVKTFCHPNAPDRIVAETSMNNGIAAYQLVDTDSSGSFDLRREFDAYGRIAKEEPWPGDTAS